MQETLLRFGHSPDADDAYMYFGIANDLVEAPGYRIEHELAEIEALNQRAMQGELEMTAVSAHAYPHIADKYAILGCGASVARGYGPRIVARSPLALEDLAGKRIAVPGQLTTAFLLARIFCPPFEAKCVGFDQVEEEMAKGDCDAAILIHEGQIQVEERGYHMVADLGRLFLDETGLPVPLGLDVVRRDLGAEGMRAAHSALRQSIQIAHDRHEEALDYALPFGRGIDRETADRFVRMYVNADTLDMPQDVLDGLKALYAMAVSKGHLAAPPPLDIVWGEDAKADA